MLRDLGVEKLRRGRHAEVVQVEQQLPGQAKAFVDVEALIQIGIVDQPFPADRGARLLEVGPHDDDEVAGVAVRERLEPLAVLERGLRIVNRARADDDGEPRIGAAEDVHQRHARVGDEVRRLLADGDLLEQDRRRNERPHVPDAQIVGASKHGIIAASK